ncbi:MAG TPA: DUF4159 domain-containing protein [Candidatus Synoicihabitans sp.]|nr:DUF4159 domain-containing protein [Candidatus Synoicihabitans sp.]
MNSPRAHPPSLIVSAPRTWRAWLGVSVLALLAPFAFPPTAHGQFGGWRSFDDRGHVPEWSVDPAFKHDVFSFARLRYTSYGRGFGGWGGRRRGQWATDAPDADLNLLFRLQQMTSLKANPQVTYIDITPDQLSQYPFVYMIEPGALTFHPDEVEALRAYLLNGGFMMVDDFWGEGEWQNFYEEIKRVFPDREPVELPIEHPIFHIVFDLKQKPQMPSIHHFLNSGLTYERLGTEEVHYKGIFDDRGRLMMIICHNTDLGDGWEREGEDPTYFERFSEKMAYPMAINILVYAMTH